MSPHDGVPEGPLRSWLFIMLGGFGYLAVDTLVGANAPGLFDLLDGSDTVSQLRVGGPPSGVSYFALAGNSHAGFKSGLGALIDLVYSLAGGVGEIDHDGIVPTASALALPGAEDRRTMPWNHTQGVLLLPTEPDLLAGWVLTPAAPDSSHTLTIE